MSRIDLKLLVVALYLIVALAYSQKTCESDIQTLISANNASKGNKFHLKVKTYIDKKNLHTLKHKINTQPCLFILKILPPCSIKIPHARLLNFDTLPSPHFYYILVNWCTKLFRYHK